MDKQQCAGKVWREHHFGRCIRNGKLEFAGKMWCSLHHEPTVKAKRKAKEEVSEKRFADWKERQRQESVNERLLKRALSWMRENQPEIVAAWEEELNA